MTETTLGAVAPDFVDMAHRIVWCTVATTDSTGRPRTRVLHPIWEWDGDRLTGFVATGPDTLKAKHLERTPFVSLTYWAADHDTCSAECDTRWLTGDDDRRRGWDRFAEAPAPVGYDPSIVPGWDDPMSPGFGVLELTPRRLRVMPGTMMTQGVGELGVWSID